MRRLLLLTICIQSSTLFTSCKHQDSIARAQPAQSAQQASGEEPAGRQYPIVKSKIAPPLPEGRAEAFFKLEMDGDQMSEHMAPARLMLFLRYGVTEQRVQISTCTEAAMGSAVGGGTETVLEVAGCEYFYSLETDAGFISVNQLENGETYRTVLRLPLPSGIERAVSPPSDSGFDPARDSQRDKARSREDQRGEQQ